MPEDREDTVGFEEEEPDPPTPTPVEEEEIDLESEGLVVQPTVLGTARKVRLLPSEIITTLGYHTAEQLVARGRAEYLE